MLKSATAAAAEQILSGLNEGDVVVLYPSDRVRDGTRVTQRDN